MPHRWYDQSPTLSMAVSLLHNASHSHQTLATHFMRQWMKQRDLLSDAERSSQDEQNRFFRFPFHRKTDRSEGIAGSIELFKHLPNHQRDELATMLINYMYMLETGLHEPEFPQETFEVDIACFKAAQ